MRTQGRASAPAFRSFVAIVLLGLSTPGCTLIGRAVGGGIKTPQGEWRPGTPAELPRVAAGDQVRLHLEDGRTLSGRVESLGSRVASEYEQMYAACRLRIPGGEVLPNLGPVQLQLLDQKTPTSVQYVGIEPTGVVVRSFESGARSKLIPFDGVLSLSTVDQSVDVLALQNLVSRHGVPSLTEIRLRDPGARVGLNEIVSVERRARKGNGFTGALWGFFIDFALLLSVLQAWGGQ